MGESAGSWSVSGHLVANNGDNEGLFRAAMGLSGGPLKVDGPERQQGMFDDMVCMIPAIDLAHVPSLQLSRSDSWGATQPRTRSIVYEKHHMRKSTSTCKQLVCLSIRL